MRPTTMSTTASDVMPLTLLRVMAVEQAVPGTSTCLVAGWFSPEPSAAPPHPAPRGTVPP
jgi:hypothetical protein